jgi:hypothetical protein
LVDKIATADILQDAINAVWVVQRVVFVCKEQIMAIHLRTALTYAAILVIGAVAGPLALASVDAAFAAKDKWSQWEQTSNLLEAYDRQYPEPIPMTQVFDSGVEDCGYKREMVFKKGDNIGAFEIHGTRWSPYTGYFLLENGWRSREFYLVVERRRLDYLQRRTSPFSAVFLDECIRRTIFRDVCGGRVGALLDAGHVRSSRESSRPIDATRQTNTICTYLDGLAARNGVPLPKRSY